MYPRGMESRDYQEYLHSEWWLHFRQRAIDYYGHRCKVCGLDWKTAGRRLDIHHYRYWKNGESILGREKLSDVCLLCEKHHPQGAYSREQVFHDRIWYLCWKTVLLPLRLLFR